MTEQKACDELNNQIMNAWKDMNKECLKPTHVPMALLTRVVNFTRVTDLLYRDQNEYTRVGKLMKDLITWMLIVRKYPNVNADTHRAKKISQCFNFAPSGGNIVRKNNYLKHF